MMKSAASWRRAVVCTPPVMPAGQTSSAAFASASRTIATPSASAAAGSSALYLPLAVTLPRTAPGSRLAPERTVMVSREMLPLRYETMNSQASWPS